MNTKEKPKIDIVYREGNLYFLPFDVPAAIQKVYPEGHLATVEPIRAGIKIPQPPITKPNYVIRKSSGEEISRGVGKILPTEISDPRD